MPVLDMLKASTRLASAEVNLGYDQGQRWTFFDRRTKAVFNGKECDCSSLSGAIAVLGGYRVNLSDPFYTGTFAERMVSAGFKRISVSGMGATTLYKTVMPGDFLLGPGHVLFVHTTTQWLSAEADESGKSSGGRGGDQSGREVRFRPPYMRSKGWTYILRSVPTTPGHGSGGSSGGGGTNPPPSTTTTTVTTTVKPDPKFPKTDNVFIDTIAIWAVESERMYGIPAPAIIAQGILESNWGKSRLSVEANALFGIKYAPPAWPAPDNKHVMGSYTISTAEYDASNKRYYVDADFCAYSSWKESLLDHGLFLNKSRYLAAKQNYARTKDVDQYCRDIKTAGYATDPQYANKLINLINQRNLRQFANLPLSIPTTTTTTTVSPPPTSTTTTSPPEPPPPLPNPVFPNPGDWYTGPNPGKPEPQETDSGWYIWQLDRGQATSGFKSWREKLTRKGFSVVADAVKADDATIENSVITQN